MEIRNVDGQVTALGSAGPFTLVVDRPTDGGGGGLGFNGGQLLYPAVAGCISNDLFRDARGAGIDLSRVRVEVSGDFVGEPAVLEEIRYEVEVAGNAPEEALRELIESVDEIAETPNWLRQERACVCENDCRRRPVDQPIRQDREWFARGTTGTQKLRSLRIC